MFGGVILGIATGSLLGLLGGGGSVIAVPILIYLLGLEAKKAIGTSLIIVGMASMLGAWSHYRKQSVIVSTALIFGMTGAIGSLAGAKIGQLIPDTLQLALFAMVMALVAFLMLKRDKPTETTAGNDAHTPLPVVLVTGLGAGILTGLIGVGGGFVIVPALTILLRIPMRKAIGTSLLVIGINSMVGAISYASRLGLHYTALPFAVGTLAATPIAGHFSHYLPQEKLKSSFAILLLILSAWMLLKQVWH
jgi:uncharacterized membrane protein YfcA